MTLRHMQVLAHRQAMPAGASLELHQRRAEPYRWHAHWTGRGKGGGHSLMERVELRHEAWVGMHEVAPHLALQRVLALLQRCQLLPAALRRRRCRLGRLKRVEEGKAGPQRAQPAWGTDACAPPAKIRSLGMPPCAQAGRQVHVVGGHTTTATGNNRRACCSFAVQGQPVADQSDQARPTRGTAMQKLYPSQHCPLSPSTMHAITHSACCYLLEGHVRRLLHHRTVADKRAIELVVGLQAVGRAAQERGDKVAVPAQEGGGGAR